MSRVFKSLFNEAAKITYHILLFFVLVGVVMFHNGQGEDFHLFIKFIISKL